MDLLVDFVLWEFGIKDLRYWYMPVTSFFSEVMNCELVPVVQIWEGMVTNQIWPRGIYETLFHHKAKSPVNSIFTICASLEEGTQPSIPLSICWDFTHYTNRAWDLDHLSCQALCRIRMSDKITFLNSSALSWLILLSFTRGNNSTWC